MYTMPDTHFLNLGQIDHKLWLLPLFNTFGVKGRLKIITNNFEGLAYV